MIDFSWKVFSMTGNIDTYLLIKEMEKDLNETPAENYEEEINKIDAH